MSPYVQPFLDFVRTLPLDFNQSVSEFDYSNPVLILADTVLSMNRKYEAFVVPRISAIKKSQLSSLSQLDDVIERGGVEAFSTVWNYNDPKRVLILQNLAQKFLHLKQRYGLDDDLEALHKWGIEARPQEWKSFGVRGIAFTTYQYLRILCGANTIKPDIHIKRAFKEAVGKNLPLEEIVEVIEATAEQLSIPAKQLDYALWNYYSRGKA